MTALLLTALISLQAQTPAEIAHQKDIDSDIALGKKYTTEVEKEFKLSTNVAMNERVQRVGAKIAEIARKKHVQAKWGDPRLNVFPYTFKVLQSDEINAFSLPGGYIYVYEGLMKAIETDDELAGVLGHEISHAEERHVITLQKEQNRLEAITLPLILISIFAGGSSNTGTAASALGTLGGLVGTALGSGWSQKAELAADYGGFQYLEDSPYNPGGLVTFMEHLVREERTEPQVLGILRSHPPSRERVDALLGYMKDKGIPLERSKVTTSFSAVAKPKKDGSVELKFGERLLGTFKGPDAATRVATYVAVLNKFFDKTPDLYEVVMQDGNILWNGELLLSFEPSDIQGTALSTEDLAATSLKEIKGALFALAFKIWDQR